VLIAAIVMESLSFRTAIRSANKSRGKVSWVTYIRRAKAPELAVVLLEDRSMGAVRTEVRCASCDSHLGHVFEGEGYEVPTDQRWCINSVSLTLEPAENDGPSAAGPS